MVNAMLYPQQATQSWIAVLLSPTQWTKWQENTAA